MIETDLLQSYYFTSFLPDLRQFGGRFGDQGRRSVDDRAGFGTGSCINHHPVLLSDTESPDRLFRGIIIRRLHINVLRHWSTTPL